MEFITFILVCIIVWLLFKKASQPYVRPMSSFDAYLIEQHKKSTERAQHIPDVKISTDANEFPDDNNTMWMSDVYVNMILKDPDDIELQKEAMSELKITKEELNKLLDNKKGK